MFTIHETKPVRSYSGEKWLTNSSNKKRLAVDFKNRCGYCGDFDVYSGGYNVYHVEHFAPKEKFKELEFTYDNLLYSCPYCNIAKSNKWVGKTATENIVGNRGFIDPCTEDYDLHLGRDEEGSIIYKTEIGEYIYIELKLYLKRHKILYNLEKIRMKRNLLKEEIENRKIKKQNSLDLENVYDELGALFSNYYDLIVEESLVHT
ncbi:HNH endonuclease [Bacillus sp. S56]|uniref:HNH endonuclease n=1 Tax=Bacillus sp. S56 TaxID=1226987 RepID=UPI0019095AD1|nr:HNH endonuclease [Bacillus sp. S56]MBK0075548.1 HNH endonuclease [Bacillus sp. S56]